MSSHQLQSQDLSVYRYERKFVVVALDHHQMAMMVRLHPSTFKTAYPDRFINNIYFDTEDYQYFKDNVEGVSNRKKIRIRWYGSLLDQNITPVLEYKIKRGPVGYKQSYRLAPIQLGSTEMNISELVQKMLKCDIPKTIALDLLSHKPTLVNRYHRKYFISNDGRFRITIDDDMQFFKVSSLICNLNWYDTDYDHTVLELKYAMDCDRDAKSISRSFPFRMTKNSKYVSGISRVYGGASN
jgi:SPX domain protein involved in polyphosphate accumulation